MKVFLIILYAWFAFGAANFLMMIFSKAGRQKFKSMTFGEGLLFTVVTIVLGPVVFVGGLIDLYKTHGKEKKDPK